VECHWRGTSDAVPVPGSQPEMAARSRFGQVSTEATHSTGAAGCVGWPLKPHKAAGTIHQARSRLASAISLARRSFPNSSSYVATGSGR